MNSSEKLRTILEQMSEKKFLNSVKHDQNNTSVKWLPVFQHSEPNITLGISKNGFWVRSNNKDVFEFIPGKPLVFLLPCLEIPRSLFFDELSKSIMKVDLPVEVMETFPTSDLLITGLISWSEHWTKHALTWITAQDITADICMHINTIAITKDKRISQSARQLANRLLRNFKPAH